jgi:hypothetical protein
VLILKNYKFVLCSLLGQCMSVIEYIVVPILDWVYFQCLMLDVRDDSIFCLMRFS